MLDIIFLKSKFIYTVRLLLILNLALVGLTAPAVAEKAESQNNYSDYGLPTHRRDGGSRGIRKHNLVALIPKKTLGVNASDSPKLFFYVPKINNQKTLEFVLRNQQDELIYEAFLTTKGEGIISIDIPLQVQADLVKNDANYHWYLSIIHDPEQRSRDVVVEGWMRQSQIDTIERQKLAQVNSVERAEMYHQKGFWYDALSVLANNYQSEAERPLIRAKWSELLTSVGLSEVASAPFVDSKIVEFSTKQ